MPYIALKPCSFGGNDFLINDKIPEDLILPESRDNLIKMGVIAAIGQSAILNDAPQTIAGNDAPQAVKIVIHDENGDIPLSVTEEGLQTVFNALTADIKEAETIVNGMTENDALILLNATDKRKGIKAATEARGKDLMSATTEETVNEK